MFIVTLIIRVLNIITRAFLVNQMILFLDETSEAAMRFFKTDKIYLIIYEYQLLFSSAL